ncbi:hypothetical protein BHE90_000885 [Fusarium euwallaceae]|uniref:C2H2-type domain-containing protein n=1 Tax=Fusarium euwallaceae TaxID=1147111 RepID=A0A430M9E1_9HYPO|nr:hypothetical protein BHE90_000885 [Fusarium euwallaceae]
MTADVDVRSQDPSWIHGTPVAKQCVGIGEVSDPRRQQDAGPTSAPTEEAPNGPVETPMPTIHRQAFADGTNNTAVQPPVTQPQEDSSVPVPGSRRGKRIYYLARVQCNNWTQEDYNRRFLFVKKELQSTVNGDPDCRDLAPYVSYELRMVGVNRDQAVPSIVINCRERDTRSLKSLFARANEKLGRGKVSLKDRLRGSKPQTKPPLPLVYCGFKGGPVTRKMSDESIRAYFGNESTYCGGLIQYQGASATLGPSLHIDGINAQLTVDHVFPPKRFVKTIAIPDLGNSPSDTPHTTPDDIDMDGLNDLCESDGDGRDSLIGLWENDDDEYDYEDEPESSIKDETSDSTSPEVDTATMKPSEQWEKIIPPETIDPSLPYLDWALAQPLPRMGSPSPPTDFVNALFPDGPYGRRVVVSRIRDGPRMHLAPVYVISGVRGVLCGHILANSTFLGSPANQADVEVWTVVMKSPQGLISGECGSVVVDQSTHEAYGHVIGCNPWGHAFVVPLRHVLSQVKVSFGATHVGLTSLWDVIFGLPSQGQLQGDLFFIKQVLATGDVDVNSRDDRGQTPLHRAAKEGNEAVARLLLEYRADKEVKSNGNQTPLHCAAEEGSEAIARLLLEHGADKEAKGHRNQTPLHYAVGSESVVKLLLEYGADKEVKDNIDRTPLHRAAEEGNEAVATLLVEHGADKEAKDYAFRTPLHYAVKKESEAVARLLLEHGADKEVKDYTGQTPLYYVVGPKLGPVVRLLLEHGGYKKAKGSDGQTPPHLAAEEEDDAISSPPSFTSNAVPSNPFPSNPFPSNSFPSNAFSSYPITSNVRARDHLHRALGEIDGFLAGMWYLDETEPLETNAPSYGPFEPVDLSRATTHPRFISQSSNEMAWSSIRDLRHSIQFYWQSFAEVSQNHHDPTINDLHKAYKDARGLREAGVFAFRNTLIGLAPNDLKKVFALCSLSYSISSPLHGRGRFENTETMADMSLWLHALESPREQEAFKILARCLWPEAHSHFDFSDPSLIIQDFDFPLSVFIAQEHHNLPDDTLQGQLAIPSYGQFGAPSLGHMPIVSPDVTGQSSSVPGAASIWMSNAEELRGTKVFVSVAQYCRDNGDFWYDLSGQGVISKDIKSILAWNQECVREKKLIYEQYLKRLLSEKNTKAVTARGIVSVVEGFIDIGHLQSTDEAKYYMTRMARLLFTDSRACDRFITWITGPEKSYSCPTCNREYRRKHNLERHYEAVHNKKVKTEGAGSGGDKIEIPMIDSFKQDFMKG